MRKRKKSPKKPLRLLDKVPTKSRRGRPGVRASEVVGRAENYGRMFWNHRLDTRKNQWVRDKPYEWAVALVKAKTADDVSHALDSASHDAQTEFKPLISLILRVCKEPAFPKTHEAQFDFLAESLAAYGRVSPRDPVTFAQRSVQRNVPNLLIKSFEKSSMLSVRVATKGLRAIMLAASAAQEFRYRWMTFSTKSLLIWRMPFVEGVCPLRRGSTRVCNSEIEIYSPHTLQ